MWNKYTDETIQNLFSPLAEWNASNNEEWLAWCLSKENSNVINKEYHAHFFTYKNI